MALSAPKKNLICDGVLSWTIVVYIIQILTTAITSADLMVEIWCNCQLP
jgi:hypothetical protein